MSNVSTCLQKAPIEIEYKRRFDPKKETIKVRSKRLTKEDYLQGGYDIYANGWGMTSQSVNRNPYLSVTSKALYSYLVSFAGSDRICYPSTNLILDELSISKDSLYQARHALCIFGYVSYTTSRGGRFGGSKTVYTIERDPKPADYDALREFVAKWEVKHADKAERLSQHRTLKGRYTSYKDSPKSDVGNSRQSEKPDVGNIYINNKNKHSSCYEDKGNNVEALSAEAANCENHVFPTSTLYPYPEKSSCSLKPHFASGSKAASADKAPKRPVTENEIEWNRFETDGLAFTKDERCGFLTLLKISMKPVHLPYLEETIKAYREALNAGYMPDAIIDAYRAYAADYRQRNRDNFTLRYATNLRDWLSTGRGLIAYCTPPQTKRKTPAAKTITQMVQRIDTREAYERYDRLIALTKIEEAACGEGKKATIDAISQERQEIIDWIKSSYQSTCNEINTEKC